jgi:L-ascorbate metabolism protein UlaG (beta-lactamase superfamily)
MNLTNGASMIENLHWLGHSSFRWEGSRVVYFDPWKLARGSKKADIIFVSHEHFDHFSKDDIALISSSDTVIVTCEAVRRQMASAEAICREVRALAPGQMLSVFGVAIVATAGYNIGKEFHTKKSGKLGCIVTMDGLRVYFAGDTDAIPEMGGYRCDVALLPVSGTYVMTADEAADAALAINPRIVVPMHYGDIIGSASDASRLKDALEGKVEVKILRKEG